MEEFSVTPVERLLEIYDIIAPTQWPAQAATVVPDLIARLGWTMTGDPSIDVDVETNLPVNFRIALVQTPKGQLTEISFGVTDMFPEGADTAPVDVAYKSLLKRLRQAFGPSAGRKDSQWWDLPTGGRLHLKNLSCSVDMQFMSRWFADVERAEARFGISPNRVLGQDE